MRPGRKKRDDITQRAKEAVIEAAEEVGLLPAPGESTHSEGSRAAMRVSRRLLDDQALTDKLCMLVFVGLSQREIAKRLGCDKNTVTRAVNAAEFQVIYGRQREILLAKMNENVVARLDEVALECLELKIDIMRANGRYMKRVSPQLQNQVANELLELWSNAKRNVKGGGLPDEFKAIWERAVRRKQADGSTITERIRLSGPPAATPPGFAAQPAERGWDDAGGSRGGDGDQRPPSEEHRATRAPEDASGAGGGGVDAGSGVVDVEPEPADNGSAETGDVGGGAAARDVQGRFGATE